MRRPLILLTAFLLDHIAGDPPNRWHPVALMGRIIAWSERRAPPPDGPIVAQLLYGLGLVSVGATLSAATGHLLARLSRRLPPPLAALLEAAALKSTFSGRGLARAARDVERTMLADDLPSARRWLGWHLVSRDVSTLSADQVAAATIESLAENTSDGILAPLFFYALAGLPAALAYRFLNTADAMLGYHDPAHEWLGKAPARLDDLANWLPARLTALLMLIAGRQEHRPTSIWRIWRRDAHLTASPNAGHPMSVMAGALGVSLEKPGHYHLGQGLPPSTPHHIAPAIRIVQRTSLLGVGLLAVLGFILGRNRRSRA